MSEFTQRDLDAALHYLRTNRLSGLDDVAERVGEEFPHLFHGRGGEKADQLFDLLAAGNPTPMSEQAAYDQAFEHLAGERQRQVEEEVPF